MRISLAHGRRVAAQKPRAFTRSERARLCAGYRDILGTTGGAMSATIELVASQVAAMTERLQTTEAAVERIDQTLGGDRGVLVRLAVIEHRQAEHAATTSAKLDAILEGQRQPPPTDGYSITIGPGAIRRLLQAFVLASFLSFGVPMLHWAGASDGLIAKLGALIAPAGATP